MKNIHFLLTLRKMLRLRNVGITELQNYLLGNYYRVRKTISVSGIFLNNEHEDARDDLNTCKFLYFDIAGIIYDVYFRVLGWSCVYLKYPKNGSCAFSVFIKVTAT